MADDDDEPTAAAPDAESHRMALRTYRSKFSKAGQNCKTLKEARASAGGRGRSVLGKWVDVVNGKFAQNTFSTISMVLKDIKRAKLAER